MWLNTGYKYEYLPVAKEDFKFNDQKYLLINYKYYNKLNKLFLFPAVMLILRMSREFLEFIKQLNEL